DSLSRHKLILIVANTEFGRVPHSGIPLDLVHNMKISYNIDERRVYASGFSAGGSFAAQLLRAFPDVFHGGVFLMGGYFYLSRQSTPGVRQPTVEPALPTWKGP